MALHFSLLRLLLPDLSLVLRQDVWSSQLHWRAILFLQGIRDRTFLQQLRLLQRLLWTLAISHPFASSPQTSVFIISPSTLTSPLFSITHTTPSVSFLLYYTNFKVTIERHPYVLATHNEPTRNHSLLVQHHSRSR